MHPLVPLAVRREFDWPLVLFQGNGELVSGKEIIATLRETVIDLVQDSVLLCGIDISRELGQLLLSR